MKVLNKLFGALRNAPAAVAACVLALFISGQTASAVPSAYITDVQTAATQVEEDVTAGIPIGLGIAVLGFGALVVIGLVMRIGKKR